MLGHHLSHHARRLCGRGDRAELAHVGSGGHEHGDALALVHLQTPPLVGPGDLPNREHRGRRRRHCFGDPRRLLDVTAAGQHLRRSPDAAALDERGRAGVDDGDRHPGLASRDRGGPDGGGLVGADVHGEDGGGTRLGQSLVGGQQLPRRRSRRRGRGSRPQALAELDGVQLVLVVGHVVDHHRHRHRRDGEPLAQLLGQHGVGVGHDAHGHGAAA